MTESRRRSVYILAMALELKANNKEVRVVREEYRTTGQKMCLGAAARLLGLPSVTLRAMLKWEEFMDFR